MIKQQWNFILAHKILTYMEGKAPLLWTIDKMHIVIPSPSNEPVHHNKIWGNGDM